MENDFDKKNEGFGGLLIFFVLTNMLAVLLMFMVYTTRPMEELTQHKPELQAGIYAITVLDAVWAAFRMWCNCWSVASKHPKTVKRVKLFLILNPVHAVLAPISAPLIFVMFASGVIPSATEIVEAYNGTVLKEILASIIYSGMWYAYFSYSKRVKNTWPRAAIPQKDAETEGNDKGAGDV